MRSAQRAGWVGVGALGVLAAGLAAPREADAWPWSPKIKAFEARAGDCGDWGVTVEARGKALPLTLLVDGKEARRWTVNGKVVQVAKGEGGLERPLRLEARLGEEDQRGEELQLRYEGSIFLQVPKNNGFAKVGQPIPLRLEVNTRCSLQGLQVELLGPKGPLVAPIPAARATTLDLPPQAPGTAMITARLLSAGGDVWLTQPLSVEVLPTFDADGDGVEAARVGGADCNDANAAIKPGLREPQTPDDIDNNCDGRVDEGTIVYDDDGDGKSEKQGDCDDADSTRYPGAAEIADCQDQDCDRQIDEGVSIVEQDDAYEPNDTQDKAFDIGSSPRRALSLVSRNASKGGGDDEWFTLYSVDKDPMMTPLQSLARLAMGVVETWYLSVEASRLGEGVAYGIEVWKGGRKIGSQTVSHAGEQLRINGSLGVEDGGIYHIALRSLRAPHGYCPASFDVYAE